MARTDVLDRGGAPRPGRPRRTGRSRRRARRSRVRAAAAIATVAVAVPVAAVVLSRRKPTPPPPACTVASSNPAATYTLSPDQAQNASIIAAVAYAKGLPDHAVTVALATALQESKLANLPFGDLDSVGLFQQRPSQGWGTRTDLLDPVYAAAAFYSRLVQVPGWATMAVTDAAQAVQRSADPSAYAQWEDEARALAVSLTGESGAGFSCRLAFFGGPAPAAGALQQAMTSEMGSDLIGVPVSAKTGWAAASWVVAHAYNYHVAHVSFAGETWSAASGRWARDARAPAGVVSVGTPGG